MYIDDSVYPDLSAAPASLDSDVAKADYLQRVCAAWDFHVHPEPETFALFYGWKDIFDRFPLPTSPGYHAFRAWFGWGAVEHIPRLPAPIPLYEHLDLIEDREPDPCAALI